jgi:Bax protein
MRKIVSYRQKLLSLARIYKIDAVLDKSLRLTTYEIELELLKNKVPIPSRRGYLAHKIINEFLKPLYISIKNTLTFQFKLSKVLKKISNNILNFFVSIIFNIKNFFTIIFNAIIDFLNNLYNFRVEKRKLDRVVLGGAYVSLVVALIYGGYFLKGLVTDNIDSLKISVEIKTDKNKKEEENLVTNLPKQEEPKPKDEVKEPSKALDTSKEEAKELAKTNNEYQPDTGYDLNAQTVLNLFEDLEYDLDKVRDEKQVKPIYFTRLPRDLDQIKTIKAKKETFLQIVLPLVVAENEKIETDRNYLLKVIRDNDSSEKLQWLKRKFKEYKVKDGDINELIEKVDIVPTSIALAQAAKESGWGTSRFALEGNAIFGQWTWDGVGIEPLDKSDDQGHKILKFPILRASVKAYITNLNTHPSYKNFREKRLMLRQSNKALSGIDLIHELENYAETGKEYTRILEQIIEQNDLQEFESVVIDDLKSSNQLKL